MELLNYINEYYDFLPLGLFEEKSEEEVKRLIIALYTNDYSEAWRSNVNVYKPNITQKELEDTLANLNILIAYQSECNSGARSAYFVFKHKKTRQIYKMEVEFVSGSTEGYQGYFELIEIEPLTSKLSFNVIEYTQFKADRIISALQEYAEQHPVL